MAMIKSNQSSKRISLPQRLTFCSMGLCLLATATGCGNGLASVSGNVTLNNAPLKGGGDVRAMVYLYPAGGTGAPAVGLVDEDGSYEITTGTQEGVLPGSYLVSISASQLIGEDIPGEPRSARRITPAKYADPRQSNLRIEVEEGSNTFDFEMEGEPPKQQRRSRRR